MTIAAETAVAPSDETLRQEVVDWLRANLPKEWVEAIDEGDDDKLRLARTLVDYNEWCAKLGEAGWATPTWPKEYGGGGVDPSQAKVVNEELARYKVHRSFNVIGIGMGGPTLLQWGSEELKKRLLPPMAQHREIWCQLFSEPGAGSDVAGLSTRAVRDGDEWVVNGQKVWTTLAHIARWGLLVARTDPDQPKHKGMSYFIVDMKAPGVEVRPLRQITGDAEFNEVFFTDVRIPDSQRLGKVGEGWKAALTTLMNERLAVGMPSGGLDVDELMELARDTDLDDGPAIKNQQVRGKIADWYVQQQGLKLTRYRTLTALSKGQTPGPESSIIKIVAAPKMQDMGAFAMEIMGQGGIMKEQVPHAAGFQAQWIGGAGFRIAGGTDEILRNIVAERVLGLPSDVRVDKDIPFNQMGARK
jgi:alkylation response protein AidB-like acyl-CoA dehydrogenase